MNYTQIKNFIMKCSNDNIAAFSAQAAFFIILSVFPLALIIITVVKSIYGDTYLVFELVKDFIPGWLAQFILAYFKEISVLSERVIISFASVTVLYASSKGMLAVIHGISNIFEERKNQGFIISRIKAIIFTVIFIVVIITVLSLLVLWNRILWQFNLDNTLLILARMLMAVCMLAFVLSLIYMFSPAKRKSLSTQLPGALFCAAGWIGFSYIYAYYISYSTRHRMLYGSISSPILFMLWLYFCMYIFFVGAEINNTLKFNLCKTQCVGNNKE